MSRLTNDIPGERMKLDSKGPDKGVPMDGPNMTIDPPNKSRYSLRSKYRTTDDYNTLVKGLNFTQQSTCEDRLMIEDFQKMEINDTLLRTVGVYKV